MIINKEELEQLKKNAKIHKIIFDEIKKVAKPGISSYDIDLLCGKICKENGVLAGFKGVYSFPANMCISVNDVVVHGVPSKKTIFKDGDLVKFDLGIKDKHIGINTDAAIAIIIGENKDKEVERFLKVNEIALKKGIEQCKIGNRVGDIGNAIQKYVEGEGFHIVRDLTGHGLGYSLHEKPYVYNYGKPGTGEKLKEGMLLAIEPIIGFSSSKIIDKGGFEFFIVDGSLGCQVEHTVLITKEGPEIII
ncbi:type I methionyl aminopeptidase [Candidatus Gracilibacteria bacterium]|nr:type I methionyl aminopeptidase [Candidatus Gracilibacteria bacterium]